jgi:hypothetical protein
VENFVTDLVLDIYLLVKLISQISELKFIVLIVEIKRLKLVVGKVSFINSLSA